MRLYLAPALHVAPYFRAPAPRPRPYGLSGIGLMHCPLYLSSRYRNRFAIYTRHCLAADDLDTNRLPVALHMFFPSRTNVFKFVYLFCSGQYHHDDILLILWTLFLPSVYISHIVKSSYLKSQIIENALRRFDTHFPLK